MADGRVIDRRRALLLASALGLGWIVGAPEAAPLEAAKRDRKERRGKDRDKKRNKDRKKHKRGKNKSKDKGKGKKGGSGGSGRKVVKEALKYKGSKYKWGGSSPKGFDCSGFAWYVYDRAAHKDIGRTVKDQYKHGKSVNKGKWKPGDVVFFKNTFEHGLSHCGIYTGGGRFIHAENERTGVVISDLDSGYYDDHYAGARRMI